MKRLHRIALFLAVTCMLPACAQPQGWGGPPPPPPPPADASETLAPAAAAEFVQLPTIASTGGSLMLPPGSGTATLTLSAAPPSGVPSTALGLAYIRITAQDAFTLNALPAFNLAIPAPDQTIAAVLETYAGGSWSVLETGWNATEFPMACFAANGPPVSLTAGASIDLALAFERNVSPPKPQGYPACPQLPPS